ncbi:hypothetical protein [Rhodoferax ferrireducens]|uniref:hypothetical protein n=1 Tax=Rhodoferax ferrireducens TaxID=192843 RepID=UPI001E31E209|nr:hypothetical protein [Rhodoferax ferrireducens]
MLNSEKLAIAAHLHVLLRRKSGRVTDTEWLASNVEYATEIVHFARARATEDGHADLAEWAGKLEAAMAEATPARGALARRLSPVTTSLTGTSASPDAGVGETSPIRYIRGIR